MNEVPCCLQPRRAGWMYMPRGMCAAVQRPAGTMLLSAAQVATVPPALQASLGSARMEQADCPAASGAPAVRGAGVCCASAGSRHHPAGSRAAASGRQRRVDPRQAHVQPGAAHEGGSSCRRLAAPAVCHTPTSYFPARPGLGAHRTSMPACSCACSWPKVSADCGSGSCLSCWPVQARASGEGLARSPSSVSQPVGLPHKCQRAVAAHVGGAFCLAFDRYACRAQPQPPHGCWPR